MAIMPLAPGRFSTITGRFNVTEMASATRRASRSGLLPTVPPMKKRSTFAGSADAAVASKTAPTRIAAAAPRRQAHRKNPSIMGRPHTRLLGARRPVRHLQLAECFLRAAQRGAAFKVVAHQRMELRDAQVAMRDERRHFVGRCNFAT